jgi:hypothetical protein
LFPAFFQGLGGLAGLTLRFCRETFMHDLESHRRSLQ